MIEGEHILIRADAGSVTGTGHLMRCLALAQAWQDAGGQATFFSDPGSPALADRLRAEDMNFVQASANPGSIEDARTTAELARSLRAQWVVLDGYKFSSGFQRILKEAGMRLLAVDDNGDVSHQYADLVLNQNIHARESFYAQREPYTRLLLGASYALLRREFLRWRDWRRRIPNMAHKVMVSLGGSDPDNVTLKVVKALQDSDLDGAEVVTLVGAANPHREEISAAAHASRWPFHVYINACDMSELLAEVDFAITAAGSTSLEMAFMALPFIVLVVADNQRFVAECLARAGITVNLGWFEDATPARIKSEAARVLQSPECRGEMSRRGRALVDGEGAERVVMQIRGDRLRLRPVRRGDCRLLWEWANDPQTRASAFSSRLVSWDEYTAWFSRSLTDPSCFMCLATDEHDAPVGQTRINLKEDGMAEIYVSVNPTRRSAGYGAVLINLGVDRLFRQNRLGCVRALIKAENIAAVRAFERAGFRQLGRQIVQGQCALAYARERSHDRK